MDDLVNYLSLRMKDLNDEDPEGYTAFSRYVLLNNFELASKLLSRGTDLNYTNRDGKTAVILALVQDNEEGVKYLLGKGADIHIEDLTGKDGCDYGKMNPQFSKYPVFKNCEKNLRKRPGIKKISNKVLKDNDETAAPTHDQTTVQLLQDETDPYINI